MLQWFLQCCVGGPGAHRCGLAPPEIVSIENEHRARDQGSFTLFKGTQRAWGRIFINWRSNSSTRTLTHSVIAGRASLIGSHTSRDVLREHEKELTRGQRPADRVASFGGSWPFIILFMLVLNSWIMLNTFILAGWNRTFDPYPYILLSLVLPMLAAIQAPVITMSRNRHSEKDRLDAEHDHEVNLKTEHKIMPLHQTLDALSEEHWSGLLVTRQEQSRMPKQLTEDICILKGGGELSLNHFKAEPSQDRE